MARRRTRLPPRFAVGAGAPPEGAYDVPANLGTTPGKPPKVSEVIKRKPGLALEDRSSPRASWPAIVTFLGGSALLALAFSRGRR